LGFELFSLSFFLIIYDTWIELKVGSTSEELSCISSSHMLLRWQSTILF